jgi:hypothetical protein
MLLENYCPSLSQNRPCPYQHKTLVSSSARHREIWTTQCVTPRPLLCKGPRLISELLSIKSCSFRTISSRYSSSGCDGL